MLVKVFSFDATAANENSSYRIALTPYSQEISYEEAEGEVVYNTEQGNLLGLEYQLSYQLHDWKLSFLGDYNEGTLTYLGLTQLGRTLTTETELSNQQYSIQLDKDLFDFTENCKTCGKISLVAGVKYEKTKRNILPKLNTEGLYENYSFSFAQVGFNWNALKLLSLDWQLRVLHEKAFKAELDLDFLSRYDNTQIPLNNVTTNLVMLSVTYPFLKNSSIGLVFQYRDRVIDKSDEFTLFKRGSSNGHFYQPQRMMTASALGIKFISYF